MPRHPQLALSVTIPLIVALTLVTPMTAIAQTAAVADKPAAKKEGSEQHDDYAVLTYDESTPGVGPIRAEDWFVKTWHDRRGMFADHKNADQHAVVFFGDSITQGWSEDFRGKFPTLKVANRGISGDTSRGLLARVDNDVLALNPSCVVLLIGTNDIELKVSPEDIAANVKLLIDKIAARDPKTPIILCQVMPANAVVRRPADLIRKLNEALADVARGNKRVMVLDTYTLFAGADGEAKLEEFPDMLHPNDIGYTKWRAALWPLFATLGIVETEPDAFTPEPGFELLFNGHNLDGWGYRVTSAAERENIEKWRAADKKMPAYPVVDRAVNFDGESASADGRFRAINGRLVATTPTEGRCVQQINTTRDFPGDFTLKLDFRATPNADSGVFIRGRQLQCRDYTLAGPYKDLKQYKPQDWNELIITVKGNEAHCTCNGEVLEAAYKIPDTGPIGVEGDRGQMEYRNIRISH